MLLDHIQPEHYIFLVELVLWRNIKTIIGYKEIYVRGYSGHSPPYLEKYGIYSDIFCTSEKSNDEANILRKPENSRLCYMPQEW